MNFLSLEEIGRRIAELRKLKGFSQADLASRIEMSRPSLAQLELGNRKLNVLELQRLSQVLGFSLDKFFSTQIEILDSSSLTPAPKKEETEYRVSEGKMDIEKFSNVLLYLLERCAGKPNVGETVIYKMLYFSDFNYYELYEEHMTGAKYHKLPFGPVPHNAQAIINLMISEEKSIQRIKTDYHNYKQRRYIPLKKANLRKLKASETEVLDQVIEQFSNWSAIAISEYSHKDIPWMVTNEGEEIDYELALYREAPFSVRNYEGEKED